MLNIEKILNTVEINTVDPFKQLNPKHIRPIISDNFGKNLAEYLNFNFTHGPWLAGGVLRKLYTGQFVGESDWDIWFRNSYQFNHACGLIDKIANASVIFKSNNAVTFQYVNNNQIYTIQLICKKFYNTPQEIINNFDFTVCQLVSDGNKILFGDQTITDLRSNTLRLTDDNFIFRENIINRIVKYTIYGYTLHPSLYDNLYNNKSQVKWKNNVDNYDTI